jgi:hypothetical protein
MHRSFVSLPAALALAVALAGCDSSSLPLSRGDGAASDGDASIADGGLPGPDLLPGSTDAPPPEDLPSSVVPDATAIDHPVFVSPDTSLAPDGPFAPPPGPDVQLLVPGQARLVGSHLTACTNAKIPSGNGDRWCAFFLPNRQIGFYDLWVINATAALAGTPPRCDGSDPNCKLLIPPGSTASSGTQLWTGTPMDGPAHPVTHRFDGDTLIFHALAPDNLEIYQGPIFAWRPGMDAPKQISKTSKAYSCSGHGATDSYLCIENIVVDMNQQVTFDLTVGRVSGAPFVVKTIVPARGDSTQWRANFSRDGQQLFFSTGGKTTLPADAETLYSVLLDAGGTPTMVGTPGISRWSISADSQKFYYLRNFNYDFGAPAGTLMMADYPTGANEVALALKVGAIVPLAEGEIDRGVAFFDTVLAGKGSFKYLKDRTKTTPADVITVAAGIGGTLGISRDLRYLYYYKDADQDFGWTDGYVAHMDGSDMKNGKTGGCVLTDQLNSDQYGTSFLPSGGLIFWVDNIDKVDGVGQGWVANPEGCTGKQQFSDKIDFWFLHESDAILYSDEGTRDFSTIKLDTILGGTMLRGSPTVVQRQSDRIYGVLANWKAVVFNIVGAPASDGLYFAKLPF